MNIAFGGRQLQRRERSTCSTNPSRINTPLQIGLQQKARHSFVLSPSLTDGRSPSFSHRSQRANHRRQITADSCERRKGLSVCAVYVWIVFFFGKMMLRRLCKGISIDLELFSNNQSDPNSVAETLRPENTELSMVEILIHTMKCVRRYEYYYVRPGIIAFTGPFTYIM